MYHENQLNVGKYTSPMNHMYGNLQSKMCFIVIFLLGRLLFDSAEYDRIVEVVPT